MIASLGGDFNEMLKDVFNDKEADQSQVVFPLLLFSFCLFVVFVCFRVLLLLGFF